MKAQPFSPADLDYIRTHYASTPAPAIAVVLGRTTLQIRAKANRMGLTHAPKPGRPLREILLERAVVGYRNVPIEGVSFGSVCTTTSNLQADGLVFASTRREGRGFVYFDTVEKARAHAEAPPPAPIPRPARKRGRPPGPQGKRAAAPTVIAPRSRAGWGPNDPMHITPQTRYTIEPTPQRALRTNTHQVFG